MPIWFRPPFRRLPRTVFDSAAGRDLIAQPAADRRHDRSRLEERTGPLPAPLSRDGQPAGIMILGPLDGDAAGRIAGMEARSSRPGRSAPVDAAAGISRPVVAGETGRRDGIRTRSGFALRDPIAFASSVALAVPARPTTLRC